MQTCLITGLPILKFKENKAEGSGHKSYIRYEIQPHDKKIVLGFCLACFTKTNKFINENKKVLAGLLLNGYPLREKDGSQRDETFEYNSMLLHKEDLEKYIEDYNVVRSPKEKLDNLFLEISKLSKYDGQIIDLQNLIINEIFINKLFFENSEELIFYLDNLEKENLIELIKTRIGVNQSQILSCKLTLDGLNHLINMTEEGDKSNRCFVAMSFDRTEEELFNNAIQPACEQFNYLAIKVNNLHAKNEQTINDLIIAEIKKSKFVICDFTKQKNGVYFEAGYALGRGKKVIYTCHRDYFDTLHFDINHFPVLIYETTAELKEMLENKIEAFIND